MNKTAIVIDSTCYMSKEELDKRGYEVIPLSVNFEDLIFKEVNDGEDKQVKKVFSEIQSRKKLPSTSQPVPQDIIDTYKKVISKGYNKIISLHISEDLSGTTQGVRTIANQLMEEDPSIEIIVKSTKSAAQASGIIVNLIDDELKVKKDLSEEEVDDIIDYYSKNIKVFFIPEDLNYLHYGGRLPQAAAAGAKILGITPVLTLTETGSIEKFKIERSAKSGIKNILKMLEKENFENTDDIILMTAHIEAEKKAKKLLKVAKDTTEGNLIKEEVSNIGIVIGNHIGPGAFGIGWVKKK